MMKESAMILGFLLVSSINSVPVPVAMSHPYISMIGKSKISPLSRFYSSLFLMKDKCLKHPNMKMLVNPMSANEFIVCAPKVPVVMRCPAGTMFNQKCQQCVYNLSAACARPKAVLTETKCMSSKECPSCRNKGQLELFATSTGRTDIYCQCPTNGYYRTAMCRYCPPGTNFNSQRRWCI